MPGARILLVEDDPIIRDLLQRNLVARGHEVRVAEDAGSALLHLQSTHFNLIILDINLPDQTGWEVLRTALQNGWLAAQEIEGEDTKLPVVVLSAVRVSPRRLDEFRPWPICLNPSRWRRSYGWPGRQRDAGMARLPIK